MDSNELLIPKLRDLVRASEKGRPAVSRFLTPEQRAEAEVFLLREHPECLARPEYAVPLGDDDGGYAAPLDSSPFFGGYPDAERCMLFLGESRLYADMDGYLRALIADGGEYASLSHRAVLGTVLALGISRDCIGDIVLPDEHRAVIFCTPAAAALILDGPEPLRRIGRDAVRVSVCTDETVSSLRRQYEAVECTVASARLDCVASALSVHGALSLGRSEIKECIRHGEVFLNHRSDVDADDSVCIGDVISVRGSGKFRIDAFDGETRRGRLRLKASKYV